MKSCINGAKPNRASSFRSNSASPKANHFPTFNLNLDTSNLKTTAKMTKMAGLFRPKKLDLSGFTNTRLIRDHNKRMAFEQTEPERYEMNPVAALRQTS